MKICKICGKEQPIKNFYKITGKQHKDSWDCRDSYCTTCRADLTHKRRILLKQKAVEYKGGKCLDCNLITDQYCVYDFHHINGKKDFSLSKFKHKSLEWLKPELDKCILLCSNCHRIRHSKNI